MKLRIATAIAFTAMAILSCNEDTGTIGTSLTSNTDKLDLSTGIFTAYSRSVAADSVYARNFSSYIGMVKDPETDTYVKSEFMTQFNMLEGYPLPDKSVLVADDDNQIYADTCEIWLYFEKSKCYGDTLTPIKMNVLELNKPMSETYTYYSNYDPVKEGYIREDGLKKSVLFTLNNHTYKDSVRRLSSYTDIARVSFNNKYTDRDGVDYQNYGTYILRKYYEHPEYFKNSYTFVNNVCPGFFFQMGDGIGVMAMLNRIDLRFTYCYRLTTDNISHRGLMTLSSTSEVLKTTKLTNDKEGLNRLIEDSTRTYLKTPAGIFTEVTLPVDNIMKEHPTDSLLSVSISFNRINSSVTDNHYLLDSPSTIMMLPKDSLYTFFEKERTYDYKSSYATTLDTNGYTFSNISNLVSRLYKRKIEGELNDPDWTKKNPNWNKVLLVPISTTTITSSSGGTMVTSLSNQIELSTTQLVGGVNSPIEIQVIYAQFKDK